jgi:tetratricopeptide (TPR) repeat protein
MLWYQFQPYAAYLAAGRFEDVSTLINATLSAGGGNDVEETFLYQGHLRRALGDLAGARAAYEEALRLNPGYGAAQEALAEIEGNN